MNGIAIAGIMIQATAAAVATVHLIARAWRPDGCHIHDGSRSGSLHQSPPTNHPLTVMFVVPNLLITDDDPAFRQVVSEGLVRRGFRVTEASDGREALELIERSEVHLALVDFHMPHVTGLDVIRHLHGRPASPPCVLMSAELDDEIRREAERMRAYHVLSKPVRLAQLTKIVCGALVDRYGWRPPDHA